MSSDTATAASRRPTLSSKNTLVDNTSVRIRVALPEARRGVLTAGTLAWARALGEFGPILVFAGATRMRTEVLSTSVFLELSVGRLEAAVAVSLLMIAAAVLVLTLVRLFGSDTTLHHPDRS